MAAPAPQPAKKSSAGGMLVTLVMLPIRQTTRSLRVCVGASQRPGAR
jgi:hypothetical protein